MLLKNIHKCNIKLKFSCWICFKVASQNDHIQSTTDNSKADNSNSGNDETDGKGQRRNFGCSFRLRPELFPERIELIETRQTGNRSEPEVARKTCTYLRFWSFISWFNYLLTITFRKYVFRIRYKQQSYALTGQIINH